MIRRARIFAAAVSILTLACLLHHHCTNTAATTRPLQRPPSVLLPANSTLGFGAILAVSHANSPRQQSLLWAANLTDIVIVIPAQKEWTVGHIEGLKAKESGLSSDDRFLTSDHETALIIEDDTDFDISIRNSQIPLLASAVRSLFSNNHGDDTLYWAHTSNWDLLYPGHCDDLISTAYLSQPSLFYTDPTVPSYSVLHPDTALFLSSLSVPSKTRILHRSYWPFCTFAYAVNRQSAALILSSFSQEPTGGSSAYDVALLSACRDQDWKCWSVAPELFHHVLGDSEIFKADRTGGGKGEAAERKTTVRGTWNLACGARHGQLWANETNEEMRKLVKGRVKIAIQRGECPIDKVVVEETWKGCELEECGAQL
ncbi:hypothetical protein G6011_03252 [Alternaria panax]|uniref:Glycosyltransferase family 25 protein n=1 Tax=Alternaria panax TaxID=48097 RepID=A0AAD4IER2_9PLEO|nr:hypothetical protein G6011_03252 [Alternaria panax]